MTPPSAPEERVPEEEPVPAARAAAGGPSPTLQARLARRRRREGDGAPPSVHLDEPVALFHDLEASRRFHRDNGIGRVFHPGAVSFRENVRNNSLHVTIVANRVSAHVDRVSPLGQRPERPPRYAIGRIALHNLSGMAADLARLLRGRQGDHRCELDCEWALAGDGPAGHDLPLLDPEKSPWSVHVEARVDATLDESRLRAALDEAAGGGHALEVVGAADATSLDAARVDLQALAVPLAETPPLRARLVRHPGGDVVMLNLNHAAADAPGAVQVLRAVADAYAGRRDAPPLDFLATRDLPVRPATARPRSVAQRYSTALEKVRDALARPARLVAAGGSDEPGHGFLVRSVGPSDPASLSGVRDPDADNDILLAALHLAISTWNADHGHHGGRIAVLVPVDLRVREWRKAVGNFSVTARVSTSPQHRESPTAALEAVSAQTARNIRTRTGTALIDALDRNGLLPLWARQSVIVLQPLTANHLLDSAVLSYVGRLEPLSFGPGAGATEGVWPSTPARMPLGLSVGAAVVSGRLHLTVRYPHRLFGPDAARRFAECYLAQIRLVATAPRKAG